MTSPPQRTVPHRGHKNVWWPSDQRQFSETEYAPQDRSSPRSDGHGDYTREDWGIRHPPEAAHVVLDRLRRSKSQKEQETLRPGIPHGSHDTEEDPRSPNSNRWSERSRESWCKPVSDENHLDRSITPVSPGPLLFSDRLDKDIESCINQVLKNPVEESPIAKKLGLEDQIIRYLRREPSTFDVRSAYTPESLRYPPRTSIETHRDTVSATYTDRPDNIPDTASEYDGDGDDEQEPPLEEWYRNASAPSPLPSRTPSAEVLDGLVSLGGRPRSVVGAMPEEPLSPLVSRYQDPKPLPLLPPAEITQFPYPYRTEIQPRRTLLRLPPLGTHHEAPRATRTSHITSQIRMPLAPESVRFPTSESYTEKSLPPDPFEPSSSTSPTLPDHSRNHPALRNQYEPSHLRNSSLGSGNSSCSSALSSPISAYNRYQSKTRESGSSQSSQPIHWNRRHSHAQSNSTQCSDSSIRHPLTTVPGLDSLPLATFSYTQPDIRATLESERPDTTGTRRHSIEDQLSIGKTPPYTGKALGMPQLRRRNTDESDQSDMKACLHEIRQEVIRNVGRRLEEAEKSSQTLQDRPSVQPRTPSLSQRFGLRRLASDARLIYSQRNTRSTPALDSNSSPALVGGRPAFGSTLRLIRSANQSSSRRSSSRSSNRFSGELSDIVERENRSSMSEPGDDVDADGTYRSKWGYLNKMKSLKSKMPGHRETSSIPTDTVPTYPYKAAKVLGLLPEDAPSGKWKHRAKKADEMVESVRRLT